MNKSEYTAIMELGASGAKLEKKVFDETLAFAQKAKVKRPSPEWLLTAPAAPAKPKAAKKAASPKEPKAKARCSVDDCEKDSRSNGMCATHYSKLVYRAVPANAEKARLASAKYAQKVRDAKALAKAEDVSDAA